jgi:putative ABC transport system ATP-binding protein
MNIRLSSLIPLPIAELPHSGSEIWEAESVLLEKGKSYLFHAPSGKGKTTLLSIIYGIRRDYQGEVYVNDKDIRKFNEREWTDLRKNRMSYIFQGLELFDDLTAMENIRIKNRQGNYFSENRIRELAVLFGIESHLHRKAGILSYGQKQRLAIIRALCQPFDFLLADEIFSHLDSETASVIFGEISSECSKRKAGLLFTALHNTPGFSFDVTFRI